jgi:hypothetical protein
MSNDNEPSETEKLQHERAERLREHIARLKSGEQPESPKKPQSLREQIDERSAEVRREESEP